jgi:uroporphyrin-III C-methyltransferase
MSFSAPLQPGEVALVGAGPGAPELLTLAAASLLADCDVIVHDALVSPPVLAMAGPGVRLIPAGKRGGRPSADQRDISDTLIRLAREGLRVVRLKGGDPFVFGRGGEEMRALAAAGIRCRVVPGITAGVAAPAVAGIPVTDRTVNSSLAFLTGHEVGEDSRIDWPALVAAFPVLVFYMGAQSLPDIARRLMAAGLPGDMPVGAISAATLPDEQVATGTLQDALDGRIAVRSPAIIVVGEVVASRVDWRSLAGAGIQE